MAGAVKYILSEDAGVVTKFVQVNLRLSHAGDCNQFLQLLLPDVSCGYALCQDVFNVLDGEDGWSAGAGHNRQWGSGRPLLHMCNNPIPAF